MEDMTLYYDNMSNNKLKDKYSKHICDYSHYVYVPHKRDKDKLQDALTSQRFVNVET